MANPNTILTPTLTVTRWLILNNANQALVEECSLWMRLAFSETWSGKSSETVQWPVTGPCLRMRHWPSAQRTVPIRKICPAAIMGMTNYRIGPHRIALNHIGPCLTMSANER